jgi:hypothetical protein
MSQEKNELPSGKQSAGVAKSTPSDNFKKLLVQADGDTRISNKEIAVVEFLEKEIQGKIPPELQAKWVSEMMLVLGEYRTEEKEIKTFCELALKKIKGELTR